MSKFYDKVVKALASASNKQGDRIIYIHPSDFDTLVRELGHLEQLHNQHGVPVGTLWTPGSWLLQVPIMKEPKLPKGSVVLEVKTWEWM